MAATSIDSGNVKIAFDDGEFSSVSILADLSLHGGSQPGETGWLSGAGAAAGNYPGNLTPFQSTNTDSTNTSGGSLRMVTVQYDKDHASADTMTFSGLNGVPLSEIVAIIGQVNGAANDHDIATFSGLVLTLTAEATSNGNSITLLMQ
tara:strand:- start:2252 stop:2695 length:444 start_codon:yes stop_codon:yes gene_type:complete